MATQDIRVTASGTAASEGSCGCCGGASPAEQAPTVEVRVGSAAKQYAVAGMTRGHCVGTVTQEVPGLADVEGADIDLVAGLIVERRSYVGRGGSLWRASEGAGHELRATTSGSGRACLVLRASGSG